MDPTECPVCMENLEGRIQCTFPCKHQVCIECFAKFQSTRCQLCRFDFTSLIPHDFPICKRLPKGITDSHSENVSFSISTFTQVLPIVNLSEDGVSDDGSFHERLNSAVGIVHRNRILSPSSDTPSGSSRPDAIVTQTPRYMTSLLRRIFLRRQTRLAPQTRTAS